MSASVWSEGKDASLAQCFLPLSPKNHKGSSGRIGVLGGSAQYTGAPYYAGMAALQAGADLAYIFCAQEAALAIKSYSPELMVAPVYTAADFDSSAADHGADDQDQLVASMVHEVTSRMERLHVLVLGPGLGRCPLVLRATAQIMKEAMTRNLSMVVDADALFLLTLDEYKNLLTGYDKVILTPNVVEYKRLLKANHGKDIAMQGIVVKKGEFDEIYYGKSDEVLTCREPGGWKRSGGLGDILAGTLGTFVGWSEILQERDEDANRQLSCWSACCVVKRATRLAFEAKRRAMTAPDVLNEVGPAMMEMEGSGSSDSTSRL